MSLSNQVGRVIGVELGGTKVVVAVGEAWGTHLLTKERFATGEDPVDLFRRLGEWWDSIAHRFTPIKAVGVGSFGPCGVHPGEPTFGSITTTPKEGWQNVNVIDHLRAIFGDVPFTYETDCNAALVGEAIWGAGKGLKECLYVVMGTGVGSGLLVNGKPLHGLIHPESGHLLLPGLAGDTFKGICRAHGACWEGLCSGPAIHARTGLLAEDLPADHPAWSLITEYTAAAIVNLIYVYSPQRVIIGGGVRKGGLLGQEEWFKLVRRYVLAKLNGYLLSSEFTLEGIGSYIVPPALGDDAGVVGAIALAQEALSKPQ